MMIDFDDLKMSVASILREHDADPQRLGFMAKDVVDLFRHSLIAENMRRMEEWPPNQGDEERRLRKLLARSIGITYGDDGELQSSEPRTAIDFKRDSVGEIESKLYERQLKRLRAASENAMQRDIDASREAHYEGDAPTLDELTARENPQR